MRSSCSNFVDPPVHSAPVGAPGLVECGAHEQSYSNCVCAVRHSVRRSGDRAENPDPGGGSGIARFSELVTVRARQVRVVRWGMSPNGPSGYTGLYFPYEDSHISSGRNVRSCRSACE